MLATFPAECRSAADNHHWAQLETLADDWLKAAPREPAAWFWMGESLRHQHRFQDAEAAYEQVPINGIRGIDAATHRMQLRFHVFHDPDSALQLADQLLEIDPRLSDPLRNRIYYFAMTAQRARLQKEILRAIEVQADLPAHYVYLMTLEEIGFSDADAVTGKWLETRPDHAFHRAVNLAHRARNARFNWMTSGSTEIKTTLDRLISEVTDLHADMPDEPVLLDFLLTIAMDQGDIDRLGELLALVPDSAADDPVFWLWHGRYALLTGDYTEAEESLQRAIALHPLAWQARNEYATLLRSTGRSQAAGPFQKLAAQGSEIFNSIRRLPHAHDIKRPLLEQIAQFAADCNQWTIAHSIFRRNQPSPRPQGAHLMRDR